MIILNPFATPRGYTRRDRGKGRGWRIDKDEVKALEIVEKKKRPIGSCPRFIISILNPISKPSYYSIDM